MFLGGSISAKPLLNNNNSPNISIIFTIQLSFLVHNADLECPKLHTFQHYDIKNSFKCINSSRNECPLGLHNLFLRDINCSYSSYSKQRQEKWKIDIQETIVSYLPKTNFFHAKFESNSLEMPISINTTKRIDTGSINSSPMTMFPHFIVLSNSRTHKFRIPIFDYDLNDTIKCKWTENKIDSKCFEACNFGLNGSAFLNEEKCELIIIANYLDVGYYPIALRIEDYLLSNDTEPLSSVPLHFVIKIEVFTENIETRLLRSPDLCYGTVSEFDVDFFGSYKSVAPMFGYIGELRPDRVQYYENPSPPNLRRKNIESGPKQICYHFGSNETSCRVDCFIRWVGLRPLIFYATYAYPQGLQNFSDIAINGSIIKWSIKANQLIKASNKRYSEIGGIIEIIRRTVAGPGRISDETYATIDIHRQPELIVYKGEWLYFYTNFEFPDGVYRVQFSGGVAFGVQKCEVASEMNLWRRESWFITFMPSRKKTTAFAEKNYALLETTFNYVPLSVNNTIPSKQSETIVKKTHASTTPTITYKITETSHFSSFSGRKEPPITSYSNKLTSTTASTNKEISPVSEYTSDITRDENNSNFRDDLLGMIPFKGDKHRVKYSKNMFFYTITIFGTLIIFVVCVIASSIIRNKGDFSKNENDIDENEEDFEQLTINERIQKYNAKTGDIQVTLSWNNYDDLDLYVVDPYGEEISHKNRVASSGGCLDIDMNFRKQSINPIENIYWPTNKAPRGKYKVYVGFFKSHLKKFNKEATNFTVFIKYGNKGKLIQDKIVLDDKKKLVYEFIL
jgi:hypothetical protein